MHHILEKIMESKRREVDRLNAVGRPFPKRGGLPLGDFRQGITAGDGITLIGEIKFASPSAGEIREASDPMALGQAYERAGVSALSVLTDREYFKGDLETLPRLKRRVALPLLRKDFILEEIQVQESFAYGADAVLLIARILSGDALKTLYGAVKGLGMHALVEIHDREDLEKALACGVDIIGINNRDLDTFEIDIRRTLELAPLVPEGTVLVSESGIRSPMDIAGLRGAGVRAVLVGTALMESPDPGLKAGELVAAGGRRHGEG